MKIIMNLMPTHLAKAEAAIDGHFNAQAAMNAQKDQEYTAKKSIALDVLAGGDVPAVFAAEADLMGLSVSDLANVIASKPDLVLERGLRRRTAIIAVRAATTSSAIDEVLKRNSVPSITTSKGI